MKLYMHPASTTCRPILIFLAENGIEIEQQLVNLSSGEHRQAAYAAVNPNRMVPTLQDGDFTLTESSAILKYLADKHGTPDYPNELQARARVNERMDWFNANLYKDLGYNLVYPQLFPHHKRATDAGQQATIEWGLAKTRHWLGILDEHILDGNDWLCGERITIADYFGACLMELGAMAGCDYSAWPNIDAWMQRARALPSWQPVHKTVYEIAKGFKDLKLRAV